MPSKIGTFAFALPLVSDTEEYRRIHWASGGLTSLRSVPRWSGHVSVDCFIKIDCLLFELNRNDILHPVMGWHTVKIGVDRNVASCELAMPLTNLAFVVSRDLALHFRHCRQQCP